MKPLLRVVDSVFDPWLTGVARPLVKGWTDLRAVRLRRLCWRLKASRLEAMTTQRREEDELWVDEMAVEMGCCFSGLWQHCLKFERFA